MGRREGRGRGRGGKWERERERWEVGEGEGEGEGAGEGEGGRWEVGSGRDVEQRKRGGSRRDDIVEGEEEGMAGEIRQKRTESRREMGVATK